LLEVKCPARHVLGRFVGMHEDDDVGAGEAQVMDSKPVHDGEQLDLDWKALEPGSGSRARVSEAPLAP